MSESETTMEAIIDVIVRLRNITLTQPICPISHTLPSPQACSYLSSRRFVEAKIREAERALLQARDEAIRIKNNW